MVDRRRSWCARLGKGSQDYTGRYPELDALRALPAGTILDGELVLVTEGRPDFHGRHRRRSGEPIKYVLFDMPVHAGRSLMKEPLISRRALLNEVLPESPALALCRTLHDGAEEPDHDKDGDEGLAQFLLEVAPYLAEPLIVQAIGAEPLPLSAGSLRVARMSGCHAI